MTTEAKTDLLKWTPSAQSPKEQEARLGTPEDGVNFYLGRYPSCYRRGPWRLLVEVCGGEHHIDWGCFDAADQPMRYYHSEANAKSEAELIARVLLTDRKKRGNYAEPEVE